MSAFLQSEQRASLLQSTEETRNIKEQQRLRTVQTIKETENAKEKSNHFQLLSNAPQARIFSSKQHTRNNLGPKSTLPTSLTNFSNGRDCFNKLTSATQLHEGSTNFESSSNQQFFAKKPNSIHYKSAASLLRPKLQQKQQRPQSTTNKQATFASSTSTCLFRTAASSRSLKKEEPGILNHIRNIQLPGRNRLTSCRSTKRIHIKRKLLL